jgi:hypothetical protein
MSSSSKPKNVDEDDGHVATTPASDVSTPKYLEPKIINKEVNEYVLKYGFVEDRVVEELRLATARHSRSRMMGDPTEAAFFSLLLKSINAKRILELVSLLATPR